MSNDLLEFNRINFYLKFLLFWHFYKFYIFSTLQNSAKLMNLSQNIPKKNY
jgi:hypothetical protein